MIEDQERNHGPRDFQRRVAVNVLGGRLTWTAAILDQRPDKDGFNEDEDSRAGVNENSEEVVDIPIEISPLVEDRIGVVSTTGGEERRHGDRQRDLTRFAGTRPAQAG